MQRTRPPGGPPGKPVRQSQPGAAAGASVTTPLRRMTRSSSWNEKRKDGAAAPANGAQARSGALLVNKKSKSGTTTGHRRPAPPPIQMHSSSARTRSPPRSAATATPTDRSLARTFSPPSMRKRRSGSTRRHSPAKSPGTLKSPQAAEEMPPPAPGSPTSPPPPTPPTEETTATSANAVPTPLLQHASESVPTETSNTPRSPLPLTPPSKLSVRGSNPNDVPNDLQLPDADDGSSAGRRAPVSAPAARRVSATDRSVAAYSSVAVSQTPPLAPTEDPVVPSPRKGNTLRSRSPPTRGSRKSMSPAGQRRSSPTSLRPTRHSPTEAHPPPAKWRTKSPAHEAPPIISPSNLLKREEPQLMPYAVLSNSSPYRGSRSRHSAAHSAPSSEPERTRPQEPPRSPLGRAFGDTPGSQSLPARRRSSMYEGGERRTSGEGKLIKRPSKSPRPISRTGLRKTSSRATGLNELYNPETKGVPDEDPDIEELIKKTRQRSPTRQTLARQPEASLVNSKPSTPPPASPQRRRSADDEPMTLDPVMTAPESFAADTGGNVDVFNRLYQLAEAESTRSQHLPSSSPNRPKARSWRSKSVNVPDAGNKTPAQGTWGPWGKTTQARSPSGSPAGEKVYAARRRHTTASPLERSPSLVAASVAKRRASMSASPARQDGNGCGAWGPWGKETKARERREVQNMMPHFHRRSLGHGSPTPSEGSPSVSPKTGRRRARTLENSPAGSPYSSTASSPHSPERMRARVVAALSDAAAAHLERLRAARRAAGSVDNIDWTTVYDPEAPVRESFMPLMDSGVPNVRTDASDILGLPASPDSTPFWGLIRSNGQLRSLESLLETLCDIGDIDIDPRKVLIELDRLNNGISTPSEDTDTEVTATANILAAVAGAVAAEQVRIVSEQNARAEKKKVAGKNRRSVSSRVNTPPKPANANGDAVQAKRPGTRGLHSAGLAKMAGKNRVDDEVPLYQELNRAGSAKSGLSRQSSYVSGIHEEDDLDRSHDDLLRSTSCVSMASSSHRPFFGRNSEYFGEVVAVSDDDVSITSQTSFARRMVTSEGEATDAPQDQRASAKKSKKPGTKRTPKQRKSPRGAKKLDGSSTNIMGEGNAKKATSPLDMKASFRLKKTSPKPSMGTNVLSPVLRKADGEYGSFRLKRRGDRQVGRAASPSPKPGKRQDGGLTNSFDLRPKSPPPGSPADPRGKKGKSPAMKPHKRTPDGFEALALSSPRDTLSKSMSFRAKRGNATSAQTVSIKGVKATKKIAKPAAETKTRQNSKPPDASANEPLLAADELWSLINKDLNANTDGNYRGPRNERGEMHGHGSLTLSESNPGIAYDGMFKDGRIEGNGRVIWRDGVMIEGDWVTLAAGGNGDPSKPARTATAAGEGAVSSNKTDIGTIYTGGMVDGVPHGEGTCVTSQALYRGKWVRGQYEGQGKLVKERETYTGEWRAGDKHGEGMHLLPDGSKYAGEYNTGKRDGVGTHHEANGDVYTGGFVNNERSGRGVLQTKSGAKYTGDFVNGKKHGTGVMVMPSGERYEGGFKNDKKEGFGKVSWGKPPNVNTFEGEWKNGRKCGWGKLTCQGGCFEGHWDHNDGHGTITSASGVYTGGWKKYIKQGHGTFEWINGDKYDGNWVNDETEGEGDFHYANGDSYHGMWQAGKRCGAGVYTYMNDSGLAPAPLSMQECVGAAGGVVAVSNVRKHPFCGQYRGNFANHRRSGNGVFTWGNGDTYTGEWQGGKRAGKGTYRWNNGTTVTGMWVDDALDKSSNIDVKMAGQR